MKWCGQETFGVGVPMTISQALTYAEPYESLHAYCLWGHGVGGLVMKRRRLFSRKGSAPLGRAVGKCKKEARKAAMARRQRRIDRG